MKLKDTDKNMLIPVIKLHFEKLGRVIAEWDSLPEGTMVNDLDRYAVARATEDQPKYKELLDRLVNGEPKAVVKPSIDLDGEQIDELRKTITHLIEARYHIDQAGKPDVWEYHPGEVFSERIADIHAAIEVLECDLSDAFPQVDPAYTAPNEPALSYITVKEALKVYGQELVNKMLERTGSMDEYRFIVRDSDTTHLLLFSWSDPLGYVSLHVGEEWETHASNPGDTHQYGKDWNNNWDILDKVRFMLQWQQD